MIILGFIWVRFSKKRANIQKKVFKMMLEHFLNIGFECL